MRANEQTRSHSLRAAFGFALSGPHMLGFVPFLTLGGYWAGGESGLIATAILLPLLLAAAGRFSPSFRHLPVQRDDLTNLVMRDGLISWLDLAIPQAAHTGRQTAVIVVSIDDLDPLELRFGREMSDTVLAESAERLKRFIRHDDIMVRFGGAGFAFGLKSVRAPETENLLQMARRLQDAFEDPFSDGSTRTYCSISVGIALTGQVETKDSADLIAAAERAGELASLSGAGSVRVYSEDLRTMPVLNRDAAGEISNALETGEIHAWYQPQLNASDNRVVGFEALARWDHPERGLISPATFLGDIEKAGLSQRLAEVILKQSLSALNAWDAAGFDVPGISINFTGDELRNPRMPDYVRWELDRHSIDPGRLVIDVLESVMSEAAEAVVSRTLKKLSRSGCRIDLDDFGTGHTSLLNVRRYNVSRIKIDRCLIAHIDMDENQRNLVSAVLSFSRRLGIETLAEGVETEGERRALGALGCDQIQGYAIARPMPLGETLLWLEEHYPPAPRLRGQQGTLAAG
jgi:diguanylate cyclase (GGDEF)-like protein